MWFSIKLTSVLCCQVLVAWPQGWYHRRVHRWSAWSPRQHQTRRWALLPSSHSGRLEPKFVPTVRKGSPIGIMGATIWLLRTPSIRTKDRGFEGKPPSDFSLITASKDAGRPIIRSIDSYEISLWCIVATVYQHWLFCARVVISSSMYVSVDTCSWRSEDLGGGGYGVNLE